jgi:hypothetical protein
MGMVEIGAADDGGSLAQLTQDLDDDFFAVTLRGQPGG